MSLRGWMNKFIDNLRGSWGTSSGLEDQPSRAFTSENLKFFRGRVTTRDGFGVTGLTSAGDIRMMYNWVAAGINKLVMQDGPNVYLIDLPGLTSSTLYTTGGTGTFVVAEAGLALYFAVFDSNVLGTSEVEITNTNIAGLPADIAFPFPPVALPVVTRTGAGLCTVGLHHIAYIIQTRTGFVGRPGPANADGSLISFGFAITAANGPSALNVAISNPGGNPNNEWLTAYVIMTRVDNYAAWFFVPGASIAIPLGGAFTVNIPVSITDEDLAAFGTDALPNFNLITRPSSGSFFLKPSFVCAYGARMVYVVNDTLYISDISAYQQLAADLNTIQSPGRKHISTVFPMRGVLYMVGDNWTYSTVDNAGYPRTWAAPQEVSSNVGTPAPYGVGWRSGGDYAWVAHESGLYLFNGMYSKLPVSYRNANIWSRINWAVAYHIQVRDYPLLHQVWVLVALDANTTPSHILMWDYTNGFDPLAGVMDTDKVDFSLYYLTAHGDISSIALVKDPTTNRSTMWLGPTTGGNHLLKQSHGDPGTPGATTDDGARIHSVWESGYCLTNAEKPAKVNRFWSYFFSVRGNGSMTVTIYNKDRTRNIVATAIVLATSPGKEYQRKAEMQSENISIRLETGSSVAGEWFDISDMNIYWKPWITNR